MPGIERFRVFKINIMDIKDLDTVTMKVNGKEIVFYCDTAKYAAPYFELVKRAADKRPEQVDKKVYTVKK